MAIQSQYPTKFYLLDLCFACVKTLRTPLHAAQRRHLGMHRVHDSCFHNDLFARLNCEVIVTVSKTDHVAERTPFKNYPNKIHPLAVLEGGDE